MTDQLTAPHDTCEWQAVSAFGPVEPRCRTVRFEECTPEDERGPPEWVEPVPATSPVCPKWKPPKELLRQLSLTETSLPVDSRQLFMAVESQLRRGVRLERLLAGFGRIMGALEISGTESPQAIYDLSEEVDRLDEFISHDWGSSRWNKLLALLLVYNAAPAVAVSMLVSILVAACNVAGVLDHTFNVSVAVVFHDGRLPVYLPCSLHGLIWPPVAFIAVLLFWQRILQVLRIRTRRVFFDKICVHQMDEDRKTQAVQSFAGFLNAADKLVILWSPRYLTRLWCVYEIASWMKLGKDFKQDVLLVPITIAPVVFLTMLLAFLDILFYNLSSGISNMITVLFAVFPAFFATWSGHLALSAFMQLKTKLEHFEVEKAECKCCSEKHRHPSGKALCCDRLLVYRTMEEWFRREGEEQGRFFLEVVNRFVQESVSPALMNCAFGRRALVKLAWFACIPTLWCNIAVAASASELLQVVGPDLTARFVVGMLLPCVLHYPCVFIFMLQALTLYNRLVGTRLGEFLWIQRLQLAGGIAVGMVTAIITVSIPFVISMYAFALDSPLPFGLSMGVWSLVCLIVSVVPWQP